MLSTNSKLGMLLYSKRLPAAKHPMCLASRAFAALRLLAEGGCVAVRPAYGKSMHDRPGFQTFCVALRHALTVAPKTTAFLDTDPGAPECLVREEGGAFSGEVILRLDRRLHRLADDPDPMTLHDDRRGNFMHEGLLSGWEALVDSLDAVAEPTAYGTLEMNLGRMVGVWLFAALNSVRTDALE